MPFATKDKKVIKRQGMKHFHMLGLHNQIIKKTSKVGDDTRQQQMVRFKAHQACHQACHYLKI